MTSTLEMFFFGCEVANNKGRLQGTGPYPTNKNAPQFSMFLLVWPTLFSGITNRKRIESPESPDFGKNLVDKV